MNSESTDSSSEASSNSSTKFPVIIQSAPAIAAIFAVAPSRIPPPTIRVISVTSLAQKEVVSAYNANKDGDFRTAATYIEQAILVEKSAVKDKTWRYRGQIYLNHIMMYCIKYTIFLLKILWLI